ncbi:hypothetical protein GCM10008965_52720 [Methylorubrum aminovorans]|nr:hypothetical protein GCM10025880_09280 [Methylorubrum aminovorans]
MRYEAVESHQDALDMLESELITINDYINICNLRKWPIDENNNIKYHNKDENSSESNIIYFKYYDSNN